MLMEAVSDRKREIARSFDDERQRERERECSYKDRISRRLFVDAGAYATAFLETLQPGFGLFAERQAAER